MEHHRKKSIKEIRKQGTRGTGAGKRREEASRKQGTGGY